MKQIRFFLFVVSVFHFKSLLGVQVIEDIPPCELAFHGGHLYEAYPHYKDLYPNLPNFPLSHGERGEGFPVEYYLHHSIPSQYRSVFREAASEWNSKVPFEAFVIRDEIDYSDISSFQEVSDSKNVIYWFNKDQHDIEKDAQGEFLKTAEVFIKPYPLRPSQPYIFISEADIAMYAEANIVIEKSSSKTQYELEEYKY